jgi:anaerobic C4-dicarboxylate transporter
MIDYLIEFAILIYTICWPCGLIILIIFSFFTATLIKNVRDEREYQRFIKEK